VGLPEAAGALKATFISQEYQIPIYGRYVLFFAKECTIKRALRDAR
jgi:hypothetical protein